MSRLSVQVGGIVQGVGFRPLALREATRRALTGWVRNRGGRVELEVQGPAGQLEAFLDALANAPPPTRIDRIDRCEVPEAVEDGFRVIESAPGRHGFDLPPDLAPCEACEREILDPRDRRYRHPFASCVACGPRYSIALDLPYDRERTTMSGFPLCPSCRQEYDDPANRRYRAEPIACPACGPRLSMLNAAGEVLAGDGAALEACADAIRHGRIAAILGLGGFQLLVDARDPAAVRRLRTRKHREEKPLAVLFPSLSAVRSVCDVSLAEERLLVSPERPIVLLRRRSWGELAPEIAAGLDEIGAFLPSTPLLQLLIHTLGFATVCTSGNRSGEPLCTEVDEARESLGAIADVFLVHDRPVARPLDDSVVRTGPLGMESLRRSRGYAPLPVARMETTRATLALGGFLKNTVALAWNGRAILSQHIADLDSARALRVFERTIEDMLAFTGATPELLACDTHPDYPSTRFASSLAERFGCPLVQVQHHHAHIAAVLAEHGVDEPALGLAWDGTGLGSDGTLWGGEALLVQGAEFRRVGHLGTLPLVGGDRAMREPARSALGLLWATHREQARPFACEQFGEVEGGLLLQALGSGFRTTRTSSVGRLFDAVASLLGIRQRCSYEGQAALELETLAAGRTTESPYPLPLAGASPWVADLAPLVDALLADRQRGVRRDVMAARFQTALVELAVAFSQRVDTRVVVLGGGCFQNRHLRRAIAARLAPLGRRVLTGRDVPVNDGGLALGQAWVASRLPS